MKTLAKIFMVMMVILCATKSAQADYCLVSSEQDTISTSVQDALRWKLEKVVYNNDEGGCAISNSFADSDVADNYIAFVTPELSAGADVREIILSYDRDNDGVIDPIKLKSIQSLIIGNPSNESVNGTSEAVYNPDHINYCKNEDGTICDAGFVVIDGTALADGVAPFECIEGANENIYLRNMVIATNGVSESELFDLVCLKDGGDVHVCNGALIKVDGEYVDPNSGADWCDTSGDCTNPTTWYLDSDGDGYGDDSETVSSCDKPEGSYVSVGGDCDDDNTAYNPGASEECGDPDYNCDGVTDEGTVWYIDADGDGYGDASAVQTAQFRSTRLSGSRFTGVTVNKPIVTTNNFRKATGATLNVDLIKIESGAATPAQQFSGINVLLLPDVLDDTDTTDVVVEGDVVTACDQPTGYVDNNDDCDDSNAAINPDATEVCDDVDNNCDGSIDEGLTTTYYQDSDGDTYGDASAPVEACSSSTGQVTDSTDCDDTDSSINPAAEEICDNDADDNCDGTVDESTCTDGETDGDGDGYTEDDGDCNDSDAAINPGATDVCGDGTDQNCDNEDRECDAEVCNDSSDNDEDGATDCDDSDCDSYFECNGFDQEELCDDDTDNEGDGFTDCEDKDCMFDEACINGVETSCNDGFDDDGDLLVDCEDLEDCGAFVVDEETGQTCADLQITPVGPGGYLSGGGGCSCDLTAHSGSSAKDALPAIVGLIALMGAAMLRNRAKASEVK